MRAKRVIILLIVFSLIITSYGCMGKESTLDTSGNQLSYKEIILSDTLGIDYVSAINANNNNELVICSEGDNTKYLVLNEKGEVQKEITLDFDGRADLFTINSSDNMYILSELSRKNENDDMVGLDTELLFYNNEGNLINEDNIISQLSDNTARTLQDRTVKIEADSKGNIYALKQNGSIEVYDNSLQMKKVIDSVEYWDIQIDEEDNLFALYKNALEKINTSSYKTIWSKKYKNTDAPESIYYNKNTKSLYGKNSNWILKYDLEGNMTNRILSTGELSTIEYIIDFTVGNNEEIYVIGENQDKYNLIKYTKAAEEEIEPKQDEEEKTEITIEVLKDWGNFFGVATRKFEKQYPNIKVTIKRNPDLDKEQYREKLNTELMAGRGTDILFLSSEDDLITYIEKGILVNLDEMIEKDTDFDIDDYNKKIIELTEYKEKLYTMPINYHKFYCSVLNTKLLDEKEISLDDNMTWTDLYNLSEKLNKDSKEKIYVLPKVEEDILFEQIILQDIDYFLDKDKKEARFNSKEFINTLELFKNIQENDIMHPELTWHRIFQEFYKLEDELNKIAILLEEINEYYYINNLGAYFNDSFNAVSAPKGEYTGNRLFYSDVLSINANSEYKEEAWEFIKFVLTEEVQERNEGMIHINNQANKRQISEVLERQEKNKNALKKRNLYFIKEEDIKELNRIGDNLNKFKANDYFHDIVYEEIQPFLNGEKTAEETAKMIQNKAEIYLLE